MKRMKRGIAGFLAALVLFFSVLGASVVVVPPVEVQANPFSAVYYAVEALMGLSGLVTGNSDDVNRLQELFSDWIMKAGSAYSSAQENWEQLNQQVDVGSGISVWDHLVKAWKDFIAGDEVRQGYIDNSIASTYSDFTDVASRFKYHFVFHNPTDECDYLFVTNSILYTDFRSVNGYNVFTSQYYDRPPFGEMYKSVSGAEFVFVKRTMVATCPAESFSSSRCNFPFYTDMDESMSYWSTVDFSSVEQPKASYGGDASQLDDTKGLAVTPDTTAPTISQQVADAIAANPGITRDEINDIVNNAVQAITDAEAVVTPTPEPEDPTHDGTILGILTAIFALLKTIATACTNFSVNIVKEVTSAMASWIKLWIDAFTSGKWATVISSFLSAIAKSIDDYLPGVADKLAALAKGIDNWQTVWAEKIATIGKAIDGFKEDVKTGVLSLGDRVMTGFRDLADVIQDLIDISAGIAGTVAGTLLSWLVNIATNIGTIADFIADILTVPITWVKSIVDAIAQAAIDVGTKIIALPGVIIDFFTIDVPAIKIAALAITAPWDNLFDPIKKLAVPLQGLSFSDNYNYPCYKMETPPVLKQFYKHDYIVLIDFEDYASYMLTVRLVVRASIWLGFAYYIIRHHMNVNFHIG